MHFFGLRIEAKTIINNENELLVKKFFLSSIEFLNRLAGKALVDIQSENNGFIFFFKNSCEAFLFFRLLEVLLYPLEIKGGMAAGKNQNEVKMNSFEAFESCEKLDSTLILKSNSKTDKYLNMLLKLRTEINDNPTIQANLVQLFSELLFPLLADFSLLKSNDMIARLSLVLKFKKEFFEFLKFVNKEESRFFNHRFPEIDFVKYGEIIDKSELDQKGFPDDYSLMVQNYWKKGYSTKVSEILGISRQIIDRNYTYLNFPNLRNLDATIAYYLQEYY